jgi:choline dehydrogenase
MFDTASASNGVKLALLEGQLLTREIDRATFIERAANLGLPAPAIGDAADKFMAIEGRGRHGCAPAVRRLRPLRNVP